MLLLEIDVQALEIDVQALQVELAFIFLIKRFYNGHKTPEIILPTCSYFCIAFLKVSFKFKAFADAKLNDGIMMTSV